MSLLALLGQRKASSTPPGPLVPGVAYGGGFYVGQMKVGGRLYNLVVADKSSERSLAYKTTSTADTGPDSVFDGLGNSNAINDANHPAASYCRSYTGGGFNDWYLGSRDEMELAFRNLKPLIQANTTATKDAATGGGAPGINVNSVPQGGAYTSVNPTQTNALNFRGTAPVGAQAFMASGPAYWTSTQGLSGSTNNAIARFFSDGSEMAVPKNNPTGIVRPMRRVLVDNPEIGSYYEGGYYMGNIKIGPEQYRIVLAPQSTESVKAWKTSATEDADAISFVDGYANCYGKNTATYPAIQYCASLNIDGFTDWYVGARDEMELVYRNFKPTDGPNSFGVRQAEAGGGEVGSNLNSVPVGIPYTDTIPKQTTVDIFKSGGSQVIGGVNQKASHWTSTNPPVGTGVGRNIYQNMYTGVQTTYQKNNQTDVGVRAIRRVHIKPNYGEARDGGYFGGRIKIGNDYYDLIVAPKSSESAMTINTGASHPAATSRFDGKSNTDALNSDVNSVAAKYCSDYRGGGFSDWYLGSMLEMEAIYRNLKGSGAVNSTITRDVGLGGGKEGENPYSSPIGYAYTANNPTLTSSSEFLSTGQQAFNFVDRYWTSTETVGAGYGPYNAVIHMGNGGTTYSHKAANNLVRPIRKVKVTL